MQSSNSKLLQSVDNKLVADHLVSASIESGVYSHQLQGVAARAEEKVSSDTCGQLETLACSSLGQLCLDTY